MAEALFRALLQERTPDWERWTIASAGTWAEEDQPPARGSFLAMRNRGLDISGHRSRTVTYEMLKEADLVLTMEPGHKEALKIEFREVSDRIFLLSEMQGQLTPVSDPYGGPLSAYEDTAEKIDAMLAKGIDRMIELVESRSAAV